MSITFPPLTTVKQQFCKRYEMKDSLSILFIGESCIVHTIEHKGADTFTGTRYAESAKIMKEIIEKQGHIFNYIPCHRVHLDFPDTVDNLMKFDAVIFSDVGACTMLLHPDTTRFCKRTPNKLKMIEEYVRRGGGFGLIGGYMTFTGIDAKGKYKDTVIEKILPVNLLPYDDRVEMPEGVDLTIDPTAHVVLNSLPREWPFVLGYNHLIAKENAEVIVKYNEDPIITLGTYSAGRTMAYATDCTPHWAPPEMYQWEYYGILWDRLLRWLAKDIG